MCTVIVKNNVFGMFMFLSLSHVVFSSRQILAGVRTATVHVKVTPDGKQYTISVTSPAFENLPQFKRREMVQKSLVTVHDEIPSFASCRITGLHLYSPSEMTDLQGQQSTE
jgi:acid stress-induced BolA-like protein IbaG/YrbA